ncbi:ADP-ribosylglycohydrolase family protein [Thermomonospora umbrina]|uniref:ADP-ribosylglycohydrolase n=1 Tax=Thermomonospora umbrina TaxID=111806 RepID=A0A3D9SJU2_9ACTN|nr:ADP-ribosylglycohydrolase family protein [Thermomonospora umbrina]REE96208.1 ADP-ribosylglycohydrolase [Thermomonospora umbrina]
MPPIERRALDALIGLSVGDAFGNRAFPAEWTVRSPAHPETWAWTDDTQMACSLLEVVTAHGRVDQDALARAFATRAETFRDYGMGALQFIDHVKHGGRWREITSRLFEGRGSWGNGGAMRVAPLGAHFHDDLERAAAEAAASAEVTHSHPEGVAGGVAIGVAAARAAAGRGRPLAGAELIETAVEHTPEGMVRDGLRRALDLLGRPAAEAAAALGNGSRISAPDTVPFALWTIATHLDDYETAVRTCVEAGGDMDTMAAIVGGVIAAHHGTDPIPPAWLAAREPLPDWLPGDTS